MPLVSIVERARLLSLCECVGQDFPPLVFHLFKPAFFQEKGFIVPCESVCPDVCCRSEDTGRKVTFSTVHEIDDDWVAANLVSRRYF